MIVSCHVPKTAGTSFGVLLQAEFGEAFHRDYGDRVGWTGPEAEAWRQARGIPAPIAAAQARGQPVVVHGHFHISKYARAYPEAKLVAFVREPVARVISNYQYLSEHPELDHPLVAEFHAAGPSLAEWAEWPWARNLQSAVLDVPLPRLAFLGLTERFEPSLRVFDALFGTALAAADPPRENISAAIDVDAATRAKIAALNTEDMRLYHAAQGRLAEAC